MNHSQQVTTAEPPPEAVVGSPRRVQWWRPLVVGCLIAILYGSVLLRLGRQWWNDPNFSHGFFVPLFSGFLLWQWRRRLAAITPQPSWWGLAIVFVGLAMLVVGTLGAELFLSRCSLIIVLAGITVYFQGWQFFRAVLFPWALLFLMIPIPSIIFNQITFPLQLLASQLAALLLPLAGVPVLREGNVIRLPAMPLEVAEACSGIRSLMSLGTLAVIYGYFLEPRNWFRVVILLAAVPIAVAANAFRVVGTGLLVQYWNPEKALGFFHDFSGWVIFMVSLMLLFAVHGLIRLVWPTKSEAP